MWDAISDMFECVVNMAVTFFVILGGIFLICAALLIIIGILVGLAALLGVI